MYVLYKVVPMEPDEIVYLSNHYELLEDKAVDMNFRRTAAEAHVGIRYIAGTRNIPVVDY